MATSCSDLHALVTSQSDESAEVFPTTVTPSQNDFPKKYRSNTCAFSESRNASPVFAVFLGK
jgi:hypothetical protein